MLNIISKAQLDKLIGDHFFNREDVNLVLFGASAYGEFLCSYLKSKNVKVKYFSDNHEAKWKGSLLDVPIISPQELTKINNVLILIASSYFKEISEQLADLGINNIYYCQEFYALKHREEVKNQEYKNNHIIYGDEGNALIKESINLWKPLLVTRMGSTELRVITEYYYDKKFSEDVKSEANNNSGIFPTTDELLNEFSKIYLNSLSKADIIGVWFNRNEGNFINNFCSDFKLVELDCVDPVLFDDPWSQVLENKRVLVIHPFIHSIKKQYAIREKLFKNKKTLPKFELLTIKAVQSLAGNDEGFGSWLEAFNYMCSEIDKVDFDVAVIGAGAYGLPLGAYIKGKGKIAIHIGGASQLLFGIKGTRWEETGEFQYLFNKYWVHPSSDERIEKFKGVERGCYW